MSVFHNVPGVPHLKKWNTGTHASLLLKRLYLQEIKVYSY